MIDVPVDRGICCHVGGDIVFDSQGNLILSTGDDSNPFDSDGFVPLDERSDRNPAFDAQRTAANTNDLRGKILRIKPKAKGGYTIPKGNLFPRGTKKTRPEIYSMGWRNPFRIEIDPDTDALWVADYSPDAKKSKASPRPGRSRQVGDRGRARQLRLALLRHRAAALQGLRLQDQEERQDFDCSAPVNTSVHNTGKRRLPPVTQPEVWYSYAKSKRFPALDQKDGGIGPMAGPAYQYDSRAARGKNSVAWPKRYDDTPLFYEWTRDYIKGFHVDGTRVGIEDVVPGIVTDNPIDMEFGPDGALYVLEYGDGYFAENPDAQLSRIDFVGKGGNRSPVPKIEAEPTAGRAPLTVAFTSKGTTDPDGDKELRYAWDFDGDGTVDSRRANGVLHLHRGRHLPGHAHGDGQGRPPCLGRRRHRRREPGAGGRVRHPRRRPAVPLRRHRHLRGQGHRRRPRRLQPGDRDLRARARHPRPPAVHGHGCTGSLVTTVPGGHDPATDDLGAVFVAEYTDTGSQPGLSGLRRGRPRAGRLTRPRRPATRQPRQPRQVPPDNPRKKATHVFRIRR